VNKDEIADFLRTISDHLLQGDRNDKATAAMLLNVVGLYVSGRADRYIDVIMAISEKEIAIINAQNN
jgi:hypothetical protein